MNTTEYLQVTKAFPLAEVAFSARTSVRLSEAGLKAVTASLSFSGIGDVAARAAKLVTAQITPNRNVFFTLHCFRG